MSYDLRETIASVLASTPSWVRHDLQSADAGMRTRAEETLAAMIEQALKVLANDPSEVAP